MRGGEERRSAEPAPGAGDPPQSQRHLSLLALLDGGDIGVVPKRYFEALPGNTFEEKEAAFIKAPVGTGPWKFVKRNIATDIEFEANLDYWEAQRVPQFARLRIIKVPEVSTRMNMLRTGEVDLAVMDSDAAKALDKEGLRNLCYP